MILVFGGTTEGRLAVKTLDEAGKPYYYSTRGDSQHIQSDNAIAVTGGMDCSTMEYFCKNKGIKLLIDAGHPFASSLHNSISYISQKLSIPVIRIEREYPPRYDDITWCENFDDAIIKLRANNIIRLLALTGVQTIQKLAPFWRQDNVQCFFRILDRTTSLETALRDGFPKDNLLMYDNGEPDELMSKIKPDAIITKESGITGGYEEKIRAARQLGIRIFTVARPQIPENFISVTGEHGLRRNIEIILPDFYPLRTGFTTGACATAASKAALMVLLSGDDDISYVSFKLPDGESMYMPVETITIGHDSASATVIKDAGDDPDITNGCRITATVTYNSLQEIHFFAGEGVGTVTLPGLGIEPGQPAINPTPRQMIKQELSELYPNGLDITVSVTGGEQLATKTFNPRLGVMGGISIIGTSGIVRPFSNEAFTESIRRAMNVALAMGCKHLVVNSGAKSERYVKSEYPMLPAQAFIHYGNAIGETMRIAQELGVKQLTIGLMIGKAVKLAEGNLDTHSRKVTLNRKFLKEIATQSGCSIEILNKIEEITLARELWDIIGLDNEKKFFKRIQELCHSVCRKKYTTGTLTTLLISETGEIIR